MILYLGWIAAAFLAGFLLANRRKRRERSLQRQMTQIPVFRGKTYSEILREVAREPKTTQLCPNGHILRTWRDEDGYSISLAFDTGDMCLGVENEASLKSV